MKLIKLSDIHYVICDDSEIKQGDWYVTFMNNEVIGEPRKCEDSFYSFNNCKKITHSNQPLECNCAVNNRKLDLNCAERNHCFHMVKPLSLSEVEELTLGYNVEKMAEKETIKNEFNSEKSYIVGFNSHKELVKDKLQKDFIRYVEYRNLQDDEYIRPIIEDFLQFISLKTEWDVQITTEGKIVLL